MRLIDADALEKRFEYLETVGNDLVHKVTEEEQGIRMAYHLAKYETHVAPTIVDTGSLLPQWIPVTERLPPEEQYVLITQKERYPGQAKEGEFHPVVKACFSDNCWFMSDGEIYFYDEDVVYAWMPLPEPYEPDGVGQEGE